MKLSGLGPSAETRATKREHQNESAKVRALPDKQKRCENLSSYVFYIFGALFLVFKPRPNQDLYILHNSNIS